MKKTVIGITDCKKFDYYVNWINRSPLVEVVKLGYRENKNRISECQGIVLSGGEDVHPRFYDKPEYLKYCMADYMDERRDDFELEVIRYTQEQSLPLLGICRGLQITNVYFGGTLIPDIPSFGRFDHRRKDGLTRHHALQVDPDSLLKQMVTTSIGDVNSLHHQSADRVGQNLVANAISPDGIIEGLERIQQDGKPWLMLVQWHPEAMVDPESCFTKNIRENFLQAAKQ